MSLAITIYFGFVVSVIVRMQESPLGSSAIRLKLSVTFCQTLHYDLLPKSAALGVPTYYTHPVSTVWRDALSTGSNGLPLLLICNAENT